MGSSRASVNAQASVVRRHERGQALVEFALIAPLFLLIVVGIIQFGIGLNYWLDLNRIANQGARWAVVDHGWTNCPKTAPAGSCTAPTLQEYLESEPVSGGLKPQACVSLPEGDGVGKPVMVRLETDFTFLPIMDLGTIKLRARATMRMEQPRTRYTLDPLPCP